MPNQFIILLAAALALLASPSALAQKATELYIPIGRSPGLSGTRTLIGHIEETDAVDHAVTVEGQGGDTWTAVFTKDTEIYIDRSRQRRRNVYGNMVDCRYGLLCEIKYADKKVEGKATIEWIKIRPR